MKLLTSLTGVFRNLTHSSKLNCEILVNDSSLIENFMQIIESSENREARFRSVGTVMNLCMYEEVGVGIFLRRDGCQGFKCFREVR